MHTCIVRAGLHACLRIQSHTYVYCMHRRGGVDNLRCSGRGVCDCACLCTQPTEPGQEIFGDACQCDNFRCTQDDQGRVCSGGCGQTANNVALIEKFR